MPYESTKLATCMIAVLLVVTSLRCSSILRHLECRRREPVSFRGPLLQAPLSITPALPALHRCIACPACIHRVGLMTFSSLATRHTVVVHCRKGKELLMAKVLVQE